MPIVFRSVTRSKGRIVFGHRLDDGALRGAMAEVDAARSRGFREVVLDLRRVTNAYADSVLPLITFVDSRRTGGTSFRVELPATVQIAQLFLNTNWASLLDLSLQHLDIEHPQHLPARRYTNHSEQQAFVNSASDLVLRNGVDLSRDLLAAVDWSVNEITDNVLNHSESPSGGLAQVDTFREHRKIKLVVADRGRGIPATMRIRYPTLGDHEAITESMKFGVTSPADAGQGNGLAGTARIARFSLGSLKILSGRASLSVFRDGRSGEYKTQKAWAPRGQKFPGTTVMLDMSTAAEFTLAEALDLESGPSMLDVIDLRYATPDGDHLIVRVCEESLGVGTRHAGAELRRKCLNLLNAEPTKRLVLDWCGLALISSSFADEAVGKLFIELGPTAFSARVTNTGAEALVASLIDRAVLQRVSQQMAAERLDDDVRN